MCFLVTAADVPEPDAQSKASLAVLTQVRRAPPCACLMWCHQRTPHATSLHWHIAQVEDKQRILIFQEMFACHKSCWPARFEHGLPGADRTAGGSAGNGAGTQSPQGDLLALFDRLITGRSKGARFQFPDVSWGHFEDESIMQGTWNVFLPHADNGGGGFGGGIAAGACRWDPVLLHRLQQHVPGVDGFQQGVLLLWCSTDACSPRQLPSLVSPELLAGDLKRC